MLSLILAVALMDAPVLPLQPVKIDTTRRWHLSADGRWYLGWRGADGNINWFPHEQPMSFRAYAPQAGNCQGGSCKRR